MAVHHGHHLGPVAVDLAMDVALDEALARIAGRRLAVRAELHQVGGRDQRRRARARHDEAVGAPVAARADVPVGIQHLVQREDAAAGDQVLDEAAAGGDFGGFLHLNRISLRRGDAKYSTPMAAAAVAASATDAPCTPIRSESGPATNAPTEIMAG